MPGRSQVPVPSHPPVPALSPPKRTGVRSFSPLSALSYGGWAVTLVDSCPYHVAYKAYHPYASCAPQMAHLCLAFTHPWNTSIDTNLQPTTICCLPMLKQRDPQASFVPLGRGDPSLASTGLARRRAFEFSMLENRDNVSTPAKDPYKIVQDRKPRKTQPSWPKPRRG